MGNVLSDSGIPMFVMTSSEEVVRRFSVGTAGVSVKKPFMWSMSETDIVQAQIILAKEKMPVCVKRLPKEFDEEVARLHLEKCGAVLTKLTQEQADYIGVPMEGPYKPEHYRY